MRDILQCPFDTTIKVRIYFKSLNALIQFFQLFFTPVCQHNMFKLSTVLESSGKIANALAPVQMLGSKDGVDDQFMGIIDDLVVMSENDSELAEGLRWIDAQSQKNGVTFYEMAMLILRKHMAERRAKEWLKNKLTQ